MNQVIGIDIGSAFISVVAISDDGNIQNYHYVAHNGKIRERLIDILDKFNISTIDGIAYTSACPDIFKEKYSVDSQIATIAASRRYFEKLGTILLVGAEKFGLIIFDNEGNYRKLRTNSSCAAGTGSFLEQQARRLNLESVEELSKMALKNNGDIPHIASRCAVFAKTDLIHAQQEGYSLESICDGLCLGLAKNIADTLFSGEEKSLPILMTGGVSLNKAVVRHLGEILGTEIITHPYSHIFPAIGAALSYIKEIDISERIMSKYERLSDIVIPEKKKRTYFYQPLELKYSSYPDFAGLESYKYHTKTRPSEKFLENPVEVDIYSKINAENRIKCYFGIDIGSTSTKAVIMDQQKNVLAGFYLRTAGNPLLAVQSIFECIDDIQQKKNTKFVFLSVGTTGSGRKFIGKIIGADLILDEISAHAKAAYDLNPETDTIIEIGGQDAKFTTMRNGMVTFSQMNTVCAAGTGSFIEEQANRLGCPLLSYADQAQGVMAPLASDRCTVFMERDINNYLNQDYSINEILATALFSVRENYLQKVAREASIGDHICFQGATAKNKALVAAFEQKLKKPIYVSKYCHLTGAMGVALLLSEGELTNRKLSEEEKKIYKSTFRGIELYKENIPIETEICNLCNNHCRIRIATVKDEKVAYGFLCGRDYNVKKYVNSNKSGFDLLKERKKVFRIPQFAPQIETFYKSKERQLKRDKELDFTIGIPAGLHLFDELPLWKYFFKLLSIKTVTSEAFKTPVALGKSLTGAEFCAPMTALHGHVKYLSEIADYLFIPYYLESREKRKDTNRYYCYYTQYSPALVSRIEEGLSERCIMPLINHLDGINHSKTQLFKELERVFPGKFKYNEISEAFDKALSWYTKRKQNLKELFYNEMSNVEDIAVVLIGRPYTILSPAMNKGIPDIIAALGIKTFYQDMIPDDYGNPQDIDPLLKAFQWHYASKMLETAKRIVDSDKLYPVLVTSFKCSPDSFVIEYFKRIMDSKGKPYLILQIDDHDSNVGYETRIEAAIRAFRNYRQSNTRSKIKNKNHYILPINPKVETGINSLNGKTILFPPWDPITTPLLAANLRREGINTILIEENPLSIQKGVKLNTNQCIPLNIIASEMIETIEKYNLEPEKTLLWMPKSDLPCNYSMYPYFIKSLLEAHSKEMGKAGVYTGEFAFTEISVKTTINAYFAYMFGGGLRRIGCKIRPYEINRGETDKAIEKSVKILEKAFQGDTSKEAALKEIVSYFDSIPRRQEHRPKVAIFGDLYVRDNEIFNQGLIYAIEDSGGEAVTTPYNEYVKIIADAYFKRWLKEGQYFELIKNKPLLTSMKLLENKFYNYFKKYFGPMPQFNGRDSEKKLAKFGILIEHTGESYDNILKIFHLLKVNPDIRLFIQANPTFCCPSLVTEAMARNIEKITGIPVLTITYDGTTEYKNTNIEPYLKYPRSKAITTEQKTRIVS